jgi:hypothetical protein
VQAYLIMGLAFGGRFEVETLGSLGTILARYAPELSVLFERERRSADPRSGIPDTVA